mgnify:FL=1
MMKRKNHLWIAVLIFAILLFFILRFTLFYIRSDGFSGLSMLLPILLLCFILFAIGMSASFAAWVYMDCKKRGDDAILWTLVIIIATPFIGLLIYFLRRPEIKRSCPACGHRISLRAKYCEECGVQITTNKEVFKVMANRKTHHLGLIITGTICMVLAVLCLTGFIVTAATGNGVNSDVTSNERIWNLGVITNNRDAYVNGVWNLNFRHASDGFVEEVTMSIHDPEKEYLHADITCVNVPEGSSLTLWLVQDDTVRSVDVTSLSEPLEYSLAEFAEGDIFVRLQINGVENVNSEISIQ